MVGKLRPLLILALCFPLVGAWPSSGKYGFISSSSSACSYTGPGDVVSGAYFYVGLRAYSAATCGTKAINVERSSDSVTCDILTSPTTGNLGNTANCSSSGDNNESAATFCNATTCSITEGYDQTGNGNNFVQATGADQPVLTLSCISSLPCMTFNGSTDTLVDSGFSNGSASFSIAVDAKNTINIGNQAPVGAPNGTIIADFNLGGGNILLVYASGASTNNATFTDGALHNFMGVMTASSTNTVAYVDNTATTLTGNASGTFTFTGGLWIGMDGNSSRPFKGTIQEVVFWNSAFNSTQAGNICHNQYSYWGGTASC